MKKILCSLLVVVMCLTIAPLQGFVGIELPDVTVKAFEMPSSGSCGENVTYTYNSDTGELIIKGTGAMYDYQYQYGESPFFDREIKSVVIEFGITTIGSGTFMSCDKIESIFIPDSITKIGDAAFMYCYNLKSITIPDGVTSIGAEAFSCCNSIVNIEIPASITYIGAEAFNSCDKLTKIIVAKDNNYFSSDDYGVLFNKRKTILIQYPNNDRSYYDIPDSVISIGSYAFYDCNNLENITIPDSVTDIGIRAFSDCDSLKSIKISDNVTNISDYAFYWCKKLENLILPDSITDIGTYAFGHCSNLENITIPDSITNIGNYAFGYCYNLEDIKISDNVTNIGDYAFFETKYYSNEDNWLNGVFYVGNHLVEVKETLSGIYSIREETKTIAVGAFKNCANLSGIIVADTNECYSSDEAGVLFNKDKTILMQYPRGNKNTSYSIPDSVISICDSAFYHCENLKDIIIADSTIAIANNSFYNCTGLENVTISDSVTSIGEDAFYNCTNLKEITIPDSVTDLGSDAFRDCKNLKIINVGKGLTNVYSSPVYGCHSLESINIDEKNPYYTSCDGVMFDKNKRILMLYPAGSPRQTYTMPDSVTRVISFAFDDCVNLKTITIPSSVITLGDFNNCNNLESFIVSSDNSCYSSIDGILFNKNKTELIKYPIGNSRQSYDIPYGVTNISKYAFRDCNNLKKVTIPESITIIGNYSFYKFTGLQEITIPENVVGINMEAFYMCTNLTSIIIPDSLIEIGSWAFSGSSSLGNVYYSGNKAQWNSISISYGNDYLKNANIHYHYNTPHTYTAVVTPSTCTTMGYTTYACTLCDDSYVADYVNKLSHKDSDGNNLCDYGCGYSFGVTDTPIPGPAVACTTYHGVTATLDSAYFESNSMNYNHDLARFCSLFTVIGYNDKTTIASRLEDCGFTVDGDYIVKNASQEQVNNFITHKKVIVNGKEHTLIFAAYIGSHKKQWYSNFDPGRGSTHKGFTNAKNYVYPILENYIKSLGVSKDETIILLTGHSRGAATTNLVAKQLIDDEKYANRENVYAYAFATPNSTSLSERKDYIYKRIFNIVNPEDLVTKMIPAAWGYGRYGITYTLPSKTNTSSSSYKAYKANMEVIYKLLLGKGAYHPYPGGEEQTYNIMCKLTDNVKNINQFYDKKFCWLNTWTTVQKFMTDTLCRYQATTGQEKEEAQSLLLKTFGTTILNSELIFKLSHYFVVYQGLGSVTDGWFMDDYFQEAHQAETYCAYLMSMSEGQIKVSRKGYQGSVNCPVDVEIYDNETGELVGRIVNNVVDEEIAAGENAIVMSVDGDSKEFWLPSDGNYEIKLIGNDEGTMDYTLSEINSDVGEASRVNFFDVEITDGLTMTAAMEAEEFIIDEHELIFEDGEKLEPTEIFTEEEIPVYNIEITAGEGGFASSSQTANSGDYVSLVATPEEGWEIDGWYEDNELISVEAEISFVAKCDRNISVKFRKIHVHEYESAITTPATHLTEGVMTYTCACGDAYTEAIAKTTEHTYNAVVTAPTCTDEGFTTYTCACGDSYVDSITGLADHTDGDGDEFCDYCDEFLGSDKEENKCSHICHKDGFMGFIWKIVKFFWKLFGMNPVCECGRAHY